MSPPKKQQPLTSFFKPKTINGLVKPHPLSLAESSESSRKRTLDENGGKVNNGVERSKKRAKSSDPGAEPITGSKAPDKATSGERIVPNLSSSDRTNRFLFDESKPSEDQAEDTDARTRREQAELHQKFVKKLGNPDALVHIKRRTFALHDETAALNGEDADGVEDDDEPATIPKGKKKGSKTGKLTPMEVQFLDIKRKHMDTVLIVEVGYKFRFFGEDARTAAKELSIVCIPGKFRYDEHPSEAHWDRFASASIPVHRLPVHAKRLVAAGHKVGVVRQIETAALKKAGDNRNAPFVRKLTNVYTKGTYVDDLGDLGQPSEVANPSGGYLLCITETPVKGGMGTDEKVNVGIIAVQPATGDIIYDSFQDGFMRSEIETRLLHISPCEFLLVGEMTKATEKLIHHLSGSSTNVFGDKCRVERVPRTKSKASEASSHVTQFYAGKLKSSRDEKANALLEKVLKLPEPVTICLSSMIKHLTEYSLEHVFDLTKYFQSFSTRSHMLINGTTLESLEVYRNQTDMTERGSLFWAIDKTLTRFGQRLLRKWIGRPLLDEQHLTERVSAVEELLENQSTFKVDQLENLLTGTKADLERSLIRIYYGKCTRPELLSVLQTLQKISMVYARVKSASDSGFESRIVGEAIAALPTIQDMMIGFLDKINPEAARKDDKYSFFREDEETEDILDQKLGIASVEQELDTHRQAAADKLGKKKPVNYATVAGIEYLVEVPNSELKKVPASWIKISGTKKLSRFHTPDITRLIRERDQHKEALAAACDRAFKELLAEIASHYQPLRDAVSALATLDCLLSLSKVAALPGFNKPSFLPSTADPTIEIHEGRHPIAEQTLESGYIPFSTTLTSPEPLAHLITGPNMGGKSSFVRAVALLTMLAQVGSFVPATAMRLTPADAIFARMGARDNLFAGESTFMVEVGETASVLRSATPRSLVLLDELGRGTSTHDGAAIAHAVLNHVVTETKCLTLFVTHYQNLARVAEGLGNGGLVKNVHMKFEAETREDGEEEVTFLYEVAEGMAHRSYGLNVARLARIPRKVVDVAREKSKELEEAVEKRKMGGVAKLVAGVMNGAGVGGDGEDDVVERLLGCVEQL
ncbi:putative dna mismatch repair protein msh3 protein [Zalerion maritima]|uniref:DNA mismatch repair protein n=1 Tax=Zalerion maritima TaxID=339359 RepID=A0AAD5WYH9_9PEZI|nr:putative dna mismatch repair protein msh3 protein [Zalerion maritima]